jgi:hypothetical protein
MIEKLRRLGRRFGKAIAAVAVAGLTAVSSGLTDNAITDPERIQVAIAVTTAASVWLVPELPTWPWIKTTLAMLLAGLNFAVTVIDGGVTGAEWVNIGLAVLGVVVIGAAPAISSTMRAAAPSVRPPRLRP